METGQVIIDRAKLVARKDPDLAARYGFPTAQ